MEENPQVSPGKNMEWVVTSFSRGSSLCRDGTWVSCTAGSLYCLSPQGSPQMVELEFKFGLAPALKLMLLHQNLPQPTAHTAWMVPVRTQSTEGRLWSGMTGQSEK